MNADYREIVCRRNPWIYFWTGTKCYHLVAGALSLKLHKFQVCRRPRYQKNFIWQKFSQDRSKLISKGSFAKDLKIFLLSTNTMYQKTLRKTFNCRVCRVLSWISNVFAMPNWPHLVSLLPVYKTKDTQNLHVTTELQYGRLFRWKFFDKQSDLQTAVEKFVILFGAFGSVLANCTKTWTLVKHAKNQNGSTSSFVDETRGKAFFDSTQKSIPEALEFIFLCEEAIVPFLGVLPKRLHYGWH